MMVWLALLLLWCLVTGLLIHGFWWRRVTSEYLWSLSESARILKNKVQRLEEDRGTMRGERANGSCAFCGDLRTREWCKPGRKTPSVVTCDKDTCIEQAREALKL